MGDVDDRLVVKDGSLPDGRYKQVSDNVGIPIYNDSGVLVGHFKGTGDDFQLDSGLRLTDSNALELFNSSSSRMGGVLASSDALEVVGIDDDLNEQPVRVLGASAILQTESIGMQFQGTEVGNFLYCEAAFDVNGDPIFKIGTSPLDVAAYSEVFTDATDKTLTTSELVLVSGTLANSYSQAFSVGSGSFRAENDTTSQVTVEFWITTDGAPPSPDDISEVIVPPKSGNSPGVAFGSLTDTADADILAGEVLQLTARVQGSGTVTITGTVQASTVRIQENVQVSALYAAASVSGTVQGGGVGYEDPDGEDIVLFYDQSSRGLRYCKFRQLVPVSLIGYEYAQAATTDNQWTTAASIPLTSPAGNVQEVQVKVLAKRTGVITLYTSEFVATFEEGVFDSREFIYERGPNIDVRADDDGAGNILIEVKGRNGQDWEWNIEYILREV